MWYNNKSVVPTPEAMQKVIDFYRQKEIDMLKLGFTSPYLANICLHKLTDSKFYPFTESDEDLLQKIREDMVGGPFIVFTRKAVVDQTFIRKSTILCTWIVDRDSIQLFPYLTCQLVPTGFYTGWNYDTESQKFMPRQNKTRPFENMVLSYFNKLIRNVRLKAMLPLADKITLIALVLMEVVTILTLSLNQWLVFPLLSMSRSSPVIDWQPNYERDKKEWPRPNVQTIYPTERIQIYWNVGVQLMGIIPNWCDSKKIFEQISPVNDLSAKNDSCKRLSMENCLVTFNATSKLLNIWRHTSTTLPQYLKILM